ncbi:hypothetical protein VKT23_013581 [Stygiomarasmius scandens]|uniref:Heterokaryon incompatibility domain-containing protein n=1 Tax=Marasmiellus scandens TaxID=2682957 RepID=A0ABR1J5F1_9AGAR
MATLLNRAVELLGVKKSLPELTVHPREVEEICPRRLIHTPTLKLVSFAENDTIPRYAILSHVHDQHEEVSLQEFLDAQANPDALIQIQQKMGYQKIQKARSIAQQLGFNYLWIDTCCINKRDPEDVSRNIKSMFAYYRNAGVCLVYLFDVEKGNWLAGSSRLKTSYWFKCGWTLQALVAPRNVLFFDKDWDFWEIRHELAYELAPETRIDEAVLKGTKSIKDVNMQERIKWVSGRKTTKPHDMVYCLMEILEAQLEVDYDEPVDKTFFRFQEELVQKHPNVRAQLVSEYLTYGYFLAAGYPIPPPTWPARESGTCPRRLIHTPTLRLIDFADIDMIPPYAIVSHRWSHGEEISYAEFCEVQNNGDANPNFETKSGCKKLQEACSMALRLGLDYLWIDACCINQRQISEVAKNIDEMYAYYRNSAVCLVYLYDVEGELDGSEWFKRGWTLQELVAPLKVLFFNRNWTYIGTRTQLKNPIAKLTQIDEHVLDGTVSIKSVDLVTRLRLIQKRRTTKPADLAYCMLGILDIKMEVKDESIDDTFRRLDDALRHAYSDLDVPVGAFTSVASLAGHDFHWKPDNGIFGILRRPRRFIETCSFRLVNFEDDNEVPYAILSHRWDDGQEVSYRELRDPSHSRLKRKTGYEKIQKACFMARLLGFSYLWIDTCCIDQTDPEDVARNIGSMYAYYQNAAVCLVYLFDMGPSLRSIAYSEWFTRGWTLQELVAPSQQLFFDQEWRYKGTKSDLKTTIAWVTGIQEEVLEGEMDITFVRVRDRIGWVRGRKTTKPQDLAYCLLGILDVELIANYEEPVEKTFQSLKEEVGRAHPEVGELPEDFFMFLAGVSQSTSSVSKNSSARIGPPPPKITYSFMADPNFWLGVCLGIIAGISASVAIVVRL